MKKLLIAAGVLAGLLLLAVLAFLAVGVSVKEFSYSTSVQIDRPVDEVWAVFTDEDRVSEWLTGLVEIENLEGEPLTVGSKWRLVFEENGNKIEMTETVTAVDPPSLYSFHMDNEMFSGETIIRLEPVDGGTRLSSTNQVIGKNVFLRSMMRLMKSMLAEQATQSYVKLKAMAEAG